MTEENQQVLDYLIELSGNTFRPVKSNLKNITARLNEGYTIQELKEVIQVKTLEWKNNPAMDQYLNPITLFRPTKFPIYLNQVKKVKENPEKYKEYYEQLNKKFNQTSASNIQSAFDDIDAMYND